MNSLFTQLARGAALALLLSLPALCMAQSPALQGPSMQEQAFAGAYNGQWLPIQQAIEKGLSVNALDPSGHTALMLASYNGHTGIVEKLLEAGADVNLTNPTGTTPLMLASSGPFPETVQVLLKAGAKVNVIDSGEHFTALMWAAAEGQTEVVKILLDNGADLTLTDIDGDTAESFAFKAGHQAIVGLLKAPDPEEESSPEKEKAEEE
jgi:ankyrin repeat protein